MTDNQVFDLSFYKGHSNSLKLNGLILRLRLVDMVIGCILHVIHVAGTSMKRAGMYGLYRGDILEVMMTSKNSLDLIPLNKSADERSGGAGS